MIDVASLEENGEAFAVEGAPTPPPPLLNRNRVLDNNRNR